jgi:drug/metabolite transporter (DMT)-like permease
MRDNSMDWKGFLAVFTLTLLWGVNYAAIRVSNTGLSPVFTTLLRSVIASLLGVLYCIATRQTVFHRDVRLFHGAVVGVLFGLEFVAIYLGILYTSTSRAAIFIYLSPFVVALGAHFLLGERLTPWKMAGLICAFVGVYFVAKGKPQSYTRLMLLGDLLEVAAAVLWGATTLYIKKYLSGTVHPINTFLYQFLFSIPVMLICAYILEPVWIIAVNRYVLSALIYQSVIVAFASYLVWFKLIHAYPVGSLSAFTFLTPVFGVLSGAAFLKEELTSMLISGLILVCLGIFLTNYRQGVT